MNPAGCFLISGSLRLSTLSKLLFINRTSHMSALIQYLKETKSELKYVSWPTKEQTVTFTIVVILISLGVAFFLGFFDFLFIKGLSFFVR